jgi:hypothetical protein
MAIITSLLLIGSVAYACSGPAGGSPPIVSSYLSVVLSASGASGNGTPNIVLSSMRPVGSSFMSPPTLITITNNGTMTATEVALQLSDHHINTTFEDETWVCLYRDGSVFFNEPLTIVEGYGQSAIGHLNLAPGATDSYIAVYYAGPTEATGCGGTFTGFSAVPYDGYPGQYNSTKPYVGGSDNPSAPSLTNPAEGGSITPTVTVTYQGVAGTLTQEPPAGKTVTVANSGGSFNDQLAVSGANGAVTYVVTSSSSHLKVTPGGAITTVGGPLSPGTYTVSGTDSDTHGDTGTWTYTLTVIKCALIQIPPTGKSVTVADSGSSFSDQLAVSGGSGAVTYVVTTSNSHLKVTTGGAITTVGGPLSAGTYTVSGSDSDTYGDTGTWTFTLTVTKGTLTQIPPTGRSVTVANSGSSFNDQLAVSGANGTVSYVVTSSNSHLKVTPGGAITTVGGPLTAGTYTVSGTDSDTYGDTGTWTFTLTVTKGTISCGNNGKGVNKSNSGGGFNDQLNASGWSGSITFGVTSSNPHLHISIGGLITTVGGPLAPGTYSFSGTDSDPYGDSGTWSYTLTVSP